MWCTMTPNTLEWLWRALERNYLIIKIRIDGVKGKVRYMNEKSVWDVFRWGMWAHDDTRSPFPVPWWKFMASVMRSTRPQVWVKPPRVFTHLCATQGGRNNNARWFPPSRMVIRHAEIKTMEKQRRKRGVSEGQTFMVAGLKQINEKCNLPTSSGWLRILLFVETSVPNSR